MPRNNNASPLTLEETVSIRSVPLHAPPSRAADSRRASLAAQRSRLRLLSYNIQAGIATRRYHHYLTHSWKHVLPYPERLENLDRIAALLGEYDVVGLQEVDGGSLRSGFVNQTEYLALKAGFPCWYDQTNRRIGKIAQHSLGLLSRPRPSDAMEVKLPGMIPGRGALTVRFGRDEDAMVVMILHLSLGRRARLRQLACIAELIREYRHVILMGDFNCRSDSMEMKWFLARTCLREPVHGLHTFPSWRPARNIDHILVSPTLEVCSTEVLNHAFSDHLPVAMEVALPGALRLRESRPGAADTGSAIA